MSTPYRELASVSSTLYALLCDAHHLPHEEALCATHRAEDARVGSDAVRALHAAQAARSAALAPKLQALLGHLEVAHNAANAIEKEFTIARTAIREKLALVQAQAHKESWAPAQFPPFQEKVDVAVLEASMDAYCKEKGIPASNKEDFLYALLSVYNAVSALSWLTCTDDSVSPEGAQNLFRRFFRSLLLCKGILGKADNSIEKTCMLIKLCIDDPEIYDLLTLNDLGQMLEIMETMEKVLKDVEPVLVEGTRSAAAEVPLREEDE